MYQNQLTPSNQQHQQPPHYQHQYSNPNSNMNYQVFASSSSSSEHDENFLMNDLNISSAGLDQDNNVPNLTIESNSLSIPFQHQQQKLQFQNNRQRSSSSLNMPNYVQKIDDLPNEDFLLLQQQPQGVNRRNSINAISPFNNNWNNIHDFTPVPGEANFSFLNVVII